MKRLTGRSTASSTKSAPLFVTLRDANDHQMLLKNATKLHDSTDLTTKSSIFINPNLIHIEHQEGFALRSELRRRKAAEEIDIVIRKGAIVKLPAARP